MATEDRELGPFKPAPDTLILAAIERAICHGAPDVWIVVVGEHLGFERTAHNTRRLRRQLEHLGAKHRWTASSERYGREYWSLTPAGRRHLSAARKAGRVGELPESPQHREWRHARVEAGFTQEVLVDRSALRTTMIVKIERGNLLPGFEVVIRMAAALLTTPSALVDGITWKPGRVLETDPQDYTVAEDESGEGS